MSALLKTVHSDLFSEFRESDFAFLRFGRETKKDEQAQVVTDARHLGTRELRRFISVF